MSGGLQPYPAYRESGVAWLGAVPAHWEVLPLRRVTSSRCDGPFGSGLKSSHYTDHGVRVIRLQNIGQAEFRNAAKAYVDPSYYSTLGDHAVEPGDVIVAGLGDERHPTGRACVAPYDIGPAMVKADCFRFRLQPARVLPGFAAYQLTATAAESAAALSAGATRQRINLQSAASREVALPPVDEQQAIVRYLDAADRRIRRYMHAKQRLIALLEEQKRLVVHRAVTRGLDPDVPMKPSGVDWLGEVPTHWTLKRFKHIAVIASGQVDPRDPVHRERPLIAPNHVQSGTGQLLRIESAANQGADSGKYEVRQGQIIYSKIRPRLRKALIAPFDCLCSADMYPISARENELSAAHLLWLLLSEPFTRYAVDCSLRVAMPKVNREALAECWMWYPSVKEQQQILRAIAQQNAPADRAIQQAQQEVALLREYRARLVADVVTGKLDVRAAADGLPGDDWRESDTTFDPSGDDPAEDTAEPEPLES